MSLYRHPDPAIAAWLADGPAHLQKELGSAVKAAIRETRQRSVLVLPVPMLRGTPTARLLLVAAAVALSIVGGLALAAGMLPPVDQTPIPSTRSDPDADTKVHVLPDAEGLASSLVRGPAGTVRLDYVIPQGWDVAIAPLPDGGRQAVAFTLDGVGPYGIGVGGTGRGVVVSDVTGATVHFNNGTVVGEGDARTFLTRLADTDVKQFQVGEVSETSLAGLPALSASISRGHVDNAGGLDFRVPSRIIVADHNGGILVAQIWAALETNLAAWVPEAMKLVSTFRLVEPPGRSCWTNPPTPLELPASGRLTLPGTSISVDYTLPRGETFDAAAEPGVVGLAQGSPGGLSYDSGSRGPGRGIVIGEALSATPHGEIVRPPFGTDAGSILNGVERQSQFVLTPYPAMGPRGLATRAAKVTVQQGIGSLSSHIDRVGPGGFDCLIDFAAPNVTSFVDVGGEVVVFQVWAVNEPALEAWLPAAKPFIESMHLVVGESP